MRRTKVSPKGQVVIPKDLREKFKIRPGETVMVEETKEGVLIIKTPKNAARSLVGLFEGEFAKSSTELVRDVRKEWNKRIDSNMAI